MAKTGSGWKGFERRIAKALGGRRVGVLGKEDVEHPILSIEAKLYGEKKFPKTLRKMYEQAQQNNIFGKLPIVVLKEKGIKDNNALVILSFSDFKRIFGGKE